MPSLSTFSNLLHISIESVRDAISHKQYQLLLATTADKGFHAIIPAKDFNVRIFHPNLHDSPVLSCALLSKHELVTISGSMSGQVIVYDHDHDRMLDERRDHKKYVVKVASWIDREGAVWAATAGWDGKVFAYLYDCNHDHPLGFPLAYVKLPTNPETLVFVKHPELSKPMLVVTRRDSTFLYYYALPLITEALESRKRPTVNQSSPVELLLLGKQNLAPHSNAWVAFSPSSVMVSPTDPSLLAIATSAIPHMKLMIVRILWPSLTPHNDFIERSDLNMDLMHTNLELLDKEDNAIQLHVSTLSPQTPYSTPQVVWRPDGSGVWVNGDDGCIRGLEAKTGKVMVTLKGGHEPGSKIRSIWSGLLKEEDVHSAECVVSGGFDRKLVVWRPQHNGIISKID